jgi:capsular exopolysaccharide synthesis family protein
MNMYNAALPLADPAVPVATSKQTISAFAWNLLRVLRRRWLVLAAFTVVAAVAALIGTSFITPQYEARALVKINPTQNALTTIEAQATVAPDQNLIDTEVAVMQSREIARAVVDELGLATDPEFTRGLPPRPSGKVDNPAVGDWYDRLAAEVLSKLSVQREKATYVIQVKFRSVSPEKAARIANGFTRQYIRFSVGARTGTAEQTADFLNKRLKLLGNELTVQDAQVAQLRADAGILEGSASGTIINQEVAPLSAQLATAQAEAAAAQANLVAAQRQMASGGIDSIAGVLESNVVSDLRRQRSEVLREKGQVDSQFGPKFPEAIKIRQQLEQLDKQIDEEAHRVINSLESQATSAAARAASLSAQVAAMRGTQASATKAAVLADSMAKQADAKRETYGRIAQNLQQATSQARNTMTQAQIVEAASPPERAAFPNKPLLLVAGVLMGLGLGTGVVFAQEVLGRGVRSAGELEMRFHLPVLAYVPQLSASALTLDGALLHPADTLIDKPLTLYAEALRLIRSALAAIEEGRGGKVITIVSALPDEGKTNTTFSLARVMAMAGERVLLIDGDLRRAGLSRIAGMQGEAGLVEVLRGGVPVRQAIRQDRVAGLSILPVVQVTFTTEDLFSGERMAGLLDDLSKDYDRILIDTPPIIGIADARTLASLSDLALLVVQWNDTPLEAVEEAVVTLRRDQSPLAGALLTRVSARADVLGPLAYARRYQHYYQGA